MKMNYKTIAMKLTMPILLVSVLSTGISLAHAESCTIKPGDARVSPGSVHQFGDLKILVTSTGQYDVGVKLKAPGLNRVFIKDWEPNTERIPEGGSVTTNICGQDVTIANKNESSADFKSYWNHIYVTIF